MAQNEAQKLQQQIGVTQTIQLVQPIETPNGTVTEVTTRRVLVKDYKQAAELYPNSAALQQIHVMALASGLMPEDFGVGGLQQAADVLYWGELIGTATTKPLPIWLGGSVSRP